MKKFTRFIVLFALLAGVGLLSIGLARPEPVSAQGLDLNAILARSAVKGYLTSLQFKSSLSGGPTTLINFYLTPEAAGSAVAQELRSNTIETFEITAEDWLDEDTYQTTAVVNPGNQIVVAQSEKIGSRWRVTNLVWGDDAAVVQPARTDSTPAADAASDTATGSDTASDTGSDTAETTTSNDTATTTNEASAATSSNTAASTEPVPEAVATAEVIAPGLNVRSGPGVVYEIREAITQGDELGVIGINSTREWYQVTRDGQIIGWISSSPNLVTITPADANVPTVLVPRLNSSGSSTSSTSSTAPATAAPAASTSSTGSSDAGDTFILQTVTGGDFYLVRPASGEVRLLTGGIDPALSPDGTKVAYTRWSSGEVGTLFIYDLNSGTERGVLGEMYEPKSPTWSPDGSQIVLSHQQGGRREIEERCGSIGRRIPPGAFDISIRNNQLCYKLPLDTHWHLRVVNVNTSQFQDLESANYSYGPTWDPTNNWRVIFASEGGLQQLDVNQNKIIGSLTDNLRDHAPVFSPDGKWLAITYRENNVWQIQVINAADGSRRALTTTDPLSTVAVNNAAPAWSPDGSQVAFVTDRNGKWEFYVMNADGSNQRPLLSAAIAEKIPAQYNGVDERLIDWQ